MLIHIFERPSWTQHTQNWNNYHIFPSWEITFLSPITANVLILILVVTCFVGVGLELGYKRNTSNAYQVYASAVILFIKAVFNLTSFALIAEGMAPVSCSPIEGFLCLLIELQYDIHMTFFLRTVPKFMLLMVVISMFICIYTAIGMFLFDPNQLEAQLYFTDYGVALWNMIMVLNSANWPGPMMPAVIENRAFVIYFYAFLLIVNWGLLNLLLGFNYFFFETEVNIVYVMQEKTRVDNKAEAFRILDVEKKGFLTYEQVDVLLKEMYEYYEGVQEIPTFEERYELILALDIQSNHKIDDNDFHYIEQKCFLGALKANRAKKRKFNRYISAHVIEEQTAHVEKVSLDKIILHNGGAPGSEDIELAPRSIPRPLDRIDEGEVSQNLTTDRDSHIEATRNSSGISHTVDNTSRHSGFDNSRHSGHSGVDTSHHSGAFDAVNPTEIDEAPSPQPAQQEYTRKRRGRLINRAAEYSGRHADPKVAEWYRTIGNNQITALHSERGRPFYRFMSHVAMQIDSIYFDIFSDTVIGAVGVAVLCLEYRLDLAILYNILTLSEMLLKAWVKGFHRYTHSTRNTVDWKIAIGLLVLIILDACIPSPNHTHVIMKTLVLLRTLLFPRNIFVTNGFKNFRTRQRIALSYAFKSIDHLIFLLMVLAVMIYVFASIGQEIFGGTVRRDDPAVQASSYGQKLYWPLNFNDIPSGMVTLFTLLSENNMHITTSGFVAALSEWAEVFFALWYAFGVLFLLDVLTALFLSQYIAYLEHKSIADRAAAAKARQLLKAQQEQEQREKQLEAEQLEPDGSHTTAQQTSVADTEVSHQLARSEEGRKKEEDANAADPVPKLRRQRSQSAETISPSKAAQDSKEHTAGTADATPRHSSIGQFRGFVADSAHKKKAALQGKASEFKHTGTIGFQKMMHFLTVDEATERNPQDSSPNDLMKGRTMLSSERREHPASLKIDKSEQNHSQEDDRITVRRRFSAPTVLVIDSPPPPSSPHPARARGFSARSPEIRRLSLASSSSDSQQGELFDIDELHDDTDVGAGAIAESVGFGRSIFSNEADRAKLNDWVKKRRKVKASRAMSSHSDDENQRDGYSTPGSERRSRRNSFTSPSQDFVEFGEASSLQAQPMSDDALTSHIRARQRSGSVGRYSNLNANDADLISAMDESPMRSPAARRRSLSMMHKRFGSGGYVLEDGYVTIEMPPIRRTTSDIALNVSKSQESVRSPSPRSAPVGPPSARENKSSAPSLSLFDWCYKKDLVNPVEEAAVLLQGAIDGEDPELFTSRRGLWCFQKRTQFAAVFRVCSMLYSFLKVFQRPMWTYTHTNWDTTFYPVSGVPLLEPQVTCALNVPLLLVMFLGVLLEVGYQDTGFSTMFTNLTYARIVRNVLLFYCIAQMILVVYCLAGGPPRLAAVTSTGGILYMMWFGRRSLRKFISVLQVLPQLFKVLAVYMVMICMFAGFGLFLYNFENVGKDDDLVVDYFSDFSTSTWSLLIAMSASSYPDQIMPAYREYREFSLFFFLFMALGSLIMLKVILVVVFVEYQKASAHVTDMQRAVRQVLVAASFDTLDVDNREAIDHDQVSTVLNELNVHYPAFKDTTCPDGDTRSAFVAQLDDNHDGYIYLENYLYILDISQIRLHSRPHKTFVEAWLPNVAKGRAFQGLKNAVLFPYTNVIVDCVLAALMIANMIVRGENLYEASPIGANLSIAQVSIMLAEFCAKVLVRGWARYRRSFRNQLDCSVLMVALVTVIGAATYPGVSGFTLLLRVSLMCRFFWLPRNIRYLYDSRRMKLFAKLCWRIVGKTMTLGIVFASLLYVFATIGMIAFGGEINRNPNGSHFQALVDSRYGAAAYWSLNFNDFTSSLITVFCMLHVSDFDIIAEGFVVTTGIAARLYFIAWYVVGALLMLNIIKSYFLFEFLTIFTTATSSTEHKRSSQEQKEYPRLGDTKNAAPSTPKRSATITAPPLYLQKPDPMAVEDAKGYDETPVDPHLPDSTSPPPRQYVQPVHIDV